MRLLLIIAIATRVISFAASAEPAGKPAEDVPLESVKPQNDSFAGEWQTTFGHLTLKREGNALSGNYGRKGEALYTITGTQSGRKFTFTYDEGSVKGEGSFELDAEGLKFEGKWRPFGGSAWGDWSGTRQDSQAPRFSGVWTTDYGLMRLVQKGEKVEGCYAYGGRSDIEGTVTDGVLKLAYREANGANGKAEFKLSEDGTSFQGTWAVHGSPMKQKWAGTRLKPQAGREWLVVFEARWEGSLQEQEFSYGEMLRHFFARVPSVAVRHRTFTGPAEFARWAADLPYFVEPVILYISSHGEKDGIKIGDVTLDGKLIGEQLRFAPMVKLVHLGACLAMAGDVPQEIRKAAGPNAPPISGYSKVADWAGSAVIDFSYLDLILSRKHSPAEAVKAIRENILFSRESGAAGNVIAPAGLKILPEP